jgi:hypothetical protein
MKRKILILFIVGLSCFNCSDYLDVNQDPTFPQEVPAESILPVMFNMMMEAETFDARFIGRYIQNWSVTTADDPWDMHGYNPGSDNGGQIWRNHYYGMGLNLDLMIEDAEKNGKWYYAGAAKALRAWGWQTATDYHGEIILHQAFEPNRYVFDFDAQEDVYEMVKIECRRALAYFNMTDNTNSFVKGDLVYGGDVTKWKKFVNGILARNAHHISNKSSYNADSAIYYANLAMSANTDNFNIPHTGTTSVNSNFWGPTRANMNGIRQTAFIVGLMNGSVLGGGNDPRRPLLLAASTDGQYRGSTPTFSVTTTGTAGIPALNATAKYIYQNAAPYPIMTYTEMQFIKAEAAFKKNDLATALTAYRAGVQAHLDFVGTFLAGTALTTYNTDKATYMASAAVAQNTGELTISDIMLQKYIALYCYGIIETWVDMRRHHYDPLVYTTFAFPPNNKIYSDNAGKPAYRVRSRYNSEYVWNITSLQSIGADQPDYHTYEQWFSKPD